MPRTLPPGMTASAFAAAVKELQAAVGKDWVFTSEDDVDTYRDAYSLYWGEKEELLAAAAVAPDTAEEVQKVVKIANKYKMPLYPISTGKNLTYGGPAPTYSGSVVLDLKRMNRILKVDDKRNFALLEPGVSYYDFYNYVQEHKLKVWIDCPDPGWGSPIGNALEHGMGYTGSAYRDHFGAHCGMEVVTPTGELIRTGMGALPAADSWQDFRYGVGPYVDGLFAQSNFGIVTKMGFWLMPEPEAWLAGAVTVQNYTDLSPLIEQISYLEDSHISTGQPMFQGLLGPAGPPGAPPNADFRALMADGWPSLEKIQAYARKKGGPAWRVTLQFYGPEKYIRAGWEYAQQRISKAIPGATFDAGKFLSLPMTPEQMEDVRKVSFGVPNMEIYQMIARRPGDPNPSDGHVDLLCVCPRTAEGLHGAQKALYETQKAMNSPVTAHPFTGPLSWFHRSFMLPGTFVQNYRDNPEKNKQARDLFAECLERMAKAGYGEYRTNPFMQDLLVAQYNFNDGALLKFQEQLKDGIDPNGIISPGRYGIWPRAIRQSRAAKSRAAKARAAKAGTAAPKQSRRAKV